MTISTIIMKREALALFDRLVVEKECEIRAAMQAAGASPIEIDAYVDACRPSLAEQRGTIGRLVSVELMKAGLPVAQRNLKNVGS